MHPTAMEYMDDGPKFWYGCDKNSSDRKKMIQVSEMPTQTLFFLAIFILSRILH